MESIRLTPLSFMYLWRVTHKHQWKSQWEGEDEDVNEDKVVHGYGGDDGIGDNERDEE